MSTVSVAARCVEGEQVQGRRAVEKDEVVHERCFPAEAAEADGATMLESELDVGPGEIGTGRYGIETVEGGLHNRILKRGFADEHFVEARTRGARENAHPARGVALRVAVHKQHAAIGGGEGGGEVDRRRSLPYATLLVGDGNPVGHGLPVPFSVPCRFQCFT